MFYRKTGLVCLSLVSCAGLASAQEFFMQAPAPAAPRAPRARQVLTYRGGNTSYLGVGVADVTEERAKALNLKEDLGVEVKRVDENSPAAKAGLKENDVILEYNGQKIESVEQFIRLITETPSGRKVNLSVWRNGAGQKVQATLDSRNRGNQFFTMTGPESAAPPIPPMPEMREFRFNTDGDNPFAIFTGNSPRVGIEGETLTPQLAEFFGARQGVLVRSVTAKSPAEKAGLKAGDVITKVNGTPVESPREVLALVRSGRGKKTAAFTLIRNKKEISVSVDMPEERSLGNDREVL